MANGVYSSINGAQDANPYALSKVWERVTRSRYDGRREEHIGRELWAEAQFEGVYENRLIHTGLIGTALITNDDIKQRFPQPKWAVEAATLEGMHQIGIYMEYEMEGGRDYSSELHLEPLLMGELGELVADAEEEDFLWPLNNGEAFMTSREHSTPLFVDGITNQLSLIGRPNYFDGMGVGNILYGAPSYGMLDSIYAYGESFVNDEGRMEALRPVMIVGSPRNIRRLSRYFNTEYDIEAGNQHILSPLSDRGAAPRLLQTSRLYNPNDLFVYFEGWENDLLVKADYYGQTDTGVGGNDDVPQYRKIWTQIRSRHGMFAINNRRILKISGAALP